MVLRLTSVLFSTALGFTLAGGLLHAFQQPPRPAVQPIPAPPDVAAPPADATKTASGLASKVLQKGTGDKKPGATDMVTVHYTGWTTDGKMFDSSLVARQAEHLRRQPGDQGLGRRRAAHGRRREAAPLDPRRARVSGQARSSQGHARVRHRAARGVHVARPSHRRTSPRRRQTPSAPRRASPTRC